MCAGDECALDTLETSALETNTHLHREEERAGDDAMLEQDRRDVHAEGISIGGRKIFFKKVFPRG